ncbi:hypothetical protein, partial [Bacillus licheniformis]
WIKETWDTVSKWFTENVWDPIIKNLIIAAIQIYAHFMMAKNKVIKYWTDISDWFDEHVKDPIVGVANDISKAFEKAFGWVGKVWDKAKDFG